MKDKFFTVMGGGIIIVITILFFWSKTWREVLRYYFGRQEPDYDDSAACWNVEAH